jgi:phosphohistidine phosphatase
MPKTLYVNRHAKSSWDHPNLKDFDRPLNDRGERDAPEMGKRLKSKGIIPQLFVSSPAKRAITTARIIAKECGYSSDQIALEEDIYLASYSTLLGIVNGFDDRYDSIIIFGHNPGFTDLVEILTEEDIYNLPTCGICKITFPFDSWELISRGTGTLEYFDYPKNKT